MKAAVLNAFGAPLAIRTLPDPVLGTGEVIVDTSPQRSPATPATSSPVLATTCWSHDAANAGPLRLTVLRP